MKQINSEKIFNIPTKTFLGGLVGVVVVTSLAVLGTSVAMNATNQKNQAIISDSSEMRALSQRLSKNLPVAISGDSNAFSAIQTDLNNLQSRWDRLSNLASDNAQHNALNASWDKLNTDSSAILKNKDALLQLHKAVNALNQSAVNIQAQYQQAASSLVQTGAPAAQANAVQRQAFLTEKLTGLTNKLVQGNASAAQDFKATSQELLNNLQALRTGSNAVHTPQITDGRALTPLNHVNAALNELSDDLTAISVTAPTLSISLTKAKQAALSAQDLAEQAGALSQQAQDSSSALSIVLYVLCFLLVLCLLLLGYILYVLSNSKKSSNSTEDERDQQAILRLLDEIGGLADGDLTAQATVTEDFTGAIADSINYAIDQLRGLVGTINTMAVQVSTSAQETQATAMHLAEASDHQAQEIAGASAAINEMARSIDQVSADAAESAKVAEQSVTTANKGNELVHKTISGMDNIREQIQDTSKRIKRLGESSQEIGDIVGLINDIADQTNILALNAAIQASTAGDAGRGFAVVADEVQRLAERSSAATKQIETLVKTIQTDTNEAVISMEQTTTEVVRGARLAQDAGVSLEEIESVSKDLATLIQSISNTARQQASSAGHISNTMNVIQEITSQTSSGTTATALSIGELAKMAIEMRNSVSGFTLPEAD